MQGLKSRYDFVFSIGAACSCSSSLRGAGLQYASFPFDWVIGGSFLNRAEAVAGNFDGWFEKSDLVAEVSPAWHTKDIYQNAKTGVVYNHDFSKGIPLDQSYPAVSEKYRRRCERLIRTIECSTRSLAVYLQAPNSSDLTKEEVGRAFEVLDGRFPGKIDLLCCTCIPGVPLGTDACHRITDRIHWLKFDYRAATSRDNGVGIVDEKLMSKVLAEVIGKIPDPRTPSERREYVRKRRVARYAKLKANGYLQFVYRGLMYKLFKHLLNRLERWGVEI